MKERERESTFFGALSNKTLLWTGMNVSTGYHKSFYLLCVCGRIEKKSSIIIDIRRNYFSYNYSLNIVTLWTDFCQK